MDNFTHFECRLQLFMREFEDIIERSGSIPLTSFVS